MTESRLWRFKARFKRQETRPPTPSPPGNQSETSQATSNDYNDRQLAQIRYTEAANQLKEAIKIRKGPWGSFDFKGLGSEPEGLDDSLLKNKINAVVVSKETSIKDRRGWSKFTYAVECVFTALSPFAKNFLMVAKDAQSVISLSIVFNLCADTRAESIWFNLQRSLSLNNGFTI